MNQSIQDLKGERCRERRRRYPIYALVQTRENLRTPRADSRRRFPAGIRRRQWSAFGFEPETDDKHSVPFDNFVDTLHGGKMEELVV